MADYATNSPFCSNDSPVDTTPLTLPPPDHNMFEKMYYYNFYPVIYFLGHILINTTTMKFLDKVIIIFS